MQLVIHFNTILCLKHHYEYLLIWIIAEIALLNIIYDGMLATYH